MASPFSAVAVGQAEPMEKKGVPPEKRNGYAGPRATSNLQIDPDLPI